MNPPQSPAASTWAPIALEAILADGPTGPRPTMLKRGDDVALLYPGELHAFIGEPESAKGWLALAAVVEQLLAGNRVLYVDFEDSAANVTGRLVALGVEPEAIRDLFSYARPDEPLTRQAWRDLQPALAAGPVLVVADGLTEAFTLQGFDPDSNRHAAEWLNLVPRRILAATGAAVILIDHVTKSRDGRGRWPIGAQHKLAGVAAAFSLDVIEPLGRGRTGAVKVTVVKDRHGGLREHAADGRLIATMRVASDDDHVTVTLEPPTEATAGAERAAFRPTTLMERVSKAVEEEPGLTRNAIRSAVKGRAEYVDLSLELLTAERFVEARRDGQANRHYSLQSYRALDDDQTGSTGSQPGPHRVPDPVAGTESTGSRPLQGDPVPDSVPSPNGRGQPSPDAEAATAEEEARVAAAVAREGNNTR